MALEALIRKWREGKQYRRWGSAALCVITLLCGDVKLTAVTELPPRQIEHITKIGLALVLENVIVEDATVNNESVLASLDGSHHFSSQHRRTCHQHSVSGLRPKNAFACINRVPVWIVRAQRRPLRQVRETSITSHRKSWSLASIPQRESRGWYLANDEVIQLCVRDPDPSAHVQLHCALGVFKRQFGSGSSGSRTVRSIFGGFQQPLVVPNEQSSKEHNDQGRERLRDCTSGHPPVLWIVWPIGLLCAGALGCFLGGLIWNERRRIGAASAAVGLSLGGLGIWHLFVSALC